LPIWRDDATRPAVSSENELSSQLCKFLKAYAIKDFPMVQFNREEKQTQRRSIDISATPVEEALIGAQTYSIYDYFLVFECKRLPAPTHSREREYVTGDLRIINGGIQRFKLGLHARDLQLAVMIGYLQKDSTVSWLDRINTWILELSDNGSSADGCCWTKKELLSSFEDNISEGTAQCQSVHNRIKGLSNDIKLFHLWVVM